eukprot:3385703-Alexandrium_andersonii.AAC.1
MCTWGAQTDGRPPPPGPAPGFPPPFPPPPSPWPTLAGSSARRSIRPLSAPTPPGWRPARGAARSPR